MLPPGSARVQAFWMEHYIIDNFNGYRELHLRKDAPQEMLNLYKEVRHIQFLYRFLPVSLGCGNILPL